MLISAINNYNTYINYPNNKPRTLYTPRNVLCCDSFQRSNVISFGAKPRVPKKLQDIFSPSFFKKLMKEGIPCAYTGVKLIPKEDFSTLEKLGTLIYPIHVDIGYLQRFDPNYFYKFEQEILETLVKSHEETPEKNAFQIIRGKRKGAEKNLRIKQLNSLNRLLIEARALPKEDYINLRSTVLNHINQLTEQKVNTLGLDPATLLRMLEKMNCKDKKLENKLKRIINNIPTTDNSTDAYIVSNSKKYTSTPLMSHKISIAILSKTVGSNEHFWPQERYRTEAKGKKQPFMLSILTTHYINQLKGNMLPDEFIKKYRRFKVKENMQAHVDRLIEIHDKWETKDPKMAEVLLKYILAYKYETEKHSKLVKINIDNFIAKLNTTSKGAERLKNADTQVKKELNL